MSALCLQCGGEGELSLERHLQNATRVRALYLAAWRALNLVHHYRAECCARGDAWRADPRIVACLEQVRAYRVSICSLRTVRLGEHAWCIACRGTGLHDNTCEGCGAPVDLSTLDDRALDCVDIVVHAGCDTGHRYFEETAVLASAASAMGLA